MSLPLITNSIVKWNPFHSSFIAYDSKLKLFDVTQSHTKREAHLSKSYNFVAEVTTQVTTLSWYQHISKSQVLAYGCSSGAVYVLDWAKDELVAHAIREPKKYHTRQCTEIAWNTQIQGQLATGFDKLRKENCAVIYDLEAGGSSGHDSGEFPVLYTFSSESVISLCWVPQHSQLIAVGGDKGVLNIYDLRQGNQNAMTCMAHTHTTTRLSKKVKGIRSDPFNCNLIATFSDLSGEPVKIWDMRKLEKSKEAPLFSIHPHETVGSGPMQERTTSSSYVTAVEYSPVRANVLAVGTSQRDYVSFYSARHSHIDVVSRVPIFTINMPGGVKHLSWQGSTAAGTGGGAGDGDMGGVSHGGLDMDGDGDISGPGHHADDKIHLLMGDNQSIQSISSVAQTPEDVLCNRLLVANGAMEFMDVAVVERQPAAVGALDTMLYGQGQCLTLATPPSSQGQGSPHREQSATPFSTCQDHCTGVDVFDIDQAMRSRCAAGYSIDSGKNLQTLQDELDTFDPTSVAAGATIQLLRAWSWVDRVECLHIKDDSFNLENCGILQLLMGNSTAASSDEKLSVEVSGEGAQNILTHPHLGCSVYISYRRSVGRLLCGWAALHGVGDHSTKKTISSKSRRTASKPDSSKDENRLEEHAEAARLSDVVHESEAIENFERAAALALWHGDTALAVKVLQRTIAASSSVHDSDNDDAEGGVECSGERYIDALTPEYIQLLSLVAMCIAGYGSARNAKKEEKISLLHDDDEDGNDITERNMWSSMCASVLEQLRMTKRRSAAYLYAACQFLLEALNGPKDKDNASDGQARYSLLQDENIAFEDRVAFSCTYLSLNEMYVFLRQLEEECMAQGNIEGLVITGLNTQGGFELLQRYVDMRSDIQTAALLVARFPSLHKGDGRGDEEAVSGRIGRMEKQFLQEYRHLLNRWQFFMERAALDVELGYRFRQYQSHTRADSKLDAGNRVVPNHRLAPMGSRATESGAEGPSSSTARLCYKMPPHNDSPHIFLRCYYCSSSLPVDAMQKQHQWQTSAWLRKQKPIMHCCPQCKRPLPKCYICLSYMGLVNPQCEVKSALARRAAPSSPAQAASLLSLEADDVLRHGAELNHNVLEFGKWFMWCQHCKHGGHAGCMDSWFEVHNICGVNGCNCRCRGRPPT